MDSTDFAKYRTESDRHQGGFVDWIQESIGGPAYNGAFAQPMNTAANMVNSVFGDGTALKTELCQSSAPKNTAEELLQNVVHGASTIVWYAAAGKLCGGALRAAGRGLSVQGTAARIASSETTGLVAGAGLMDGFRDVTSGETWAGNVAGGMTAFGVFGLGNRYCREITFPNRLLANAFIGGAGGQAQVLTSALVSGRELSVGDLRQAAFHGAAANMVLPHVSEGISRAIDKGYSKLGLPVAIDRFVQKNGLTAKDPEFQAVSAEIHRNPLARATMPGNRTFGDSHSPVRAGNNSIEVDPIVVAALSSSHGISHERAFAMVTARELAALRCKNAGHPAGTLSDVEILTAAREHQLHIMETTYESGKPSSRKVEVNELIGRLGNNDLTIHQSELFAIPPEGFVVDTKGAKAEVQKWPAVLVKNGLILEPNDFVLSLTVEKIVLPSNVSATDKAPLIGQINQKSFIARSGLENHQTAPVLNNGTNNQITLEQRNNSAGNITLIPGQPAGSIVFERMSSPPLTFQKSTAHGQEVPNGLSFDRATIFDARHLPPVTLSQLRQWLREQQANSSQVSEHSSGQSTVG